MAAVASSPAGTPSKRQRTEEAKENTLAGGEGDGPAIDPKLVASDVLSQKMIEEEKKMIAAREAEDEKNRAQDLKKIKGQSKSAKVERLESLLKKSIAYSEFLANKIKKEGEGGAISVSDGNVRGPGLPQPALITGGKMRPYQLVQPRPSTPLSALLPSLATARLGCHCPFLSCPPFVDVISCST